MTKPLNLVCAALLLLTSAAQAEGERLSPIHRQPYSHYALGWGSLQLRSEADGDIHRATPSVWTSLGVGLPVRWQALRPILQAESFRLYKIKPRGDYTSENSTRHEGLGLHLGVALSFPSWQVDFLLGSGRLYSSQGEGAARQRRTFSYQSPELGLSYYIFQVAGGRLAVQANSRWFAPNKYWSDQYGYKDGWAGSLQLVLYISIAGEQKLLDKLSS